jgi:hypothetical protein
MEFKKMYDITNITTFEHGTAEYVTESNLYFERKRPLKITPTM